MREAMRRTKLISQARLPDSFQTPREVPATYESGRLVFYDRSISIGRFLGNGSFGMIFVSRDDIIKLEVAHRPKLLELDLTNWAGENGYGPALKRWGKLKIKETDFDDLLAEMTENTEVSLPHWFTELGRGDPSVYYIVMDRWDTDLQHWLNRQRNYSTALGRVAPKAMEKLVEGIRELHKLGLVHMDLLPKNILVKLDANDRVIDLGMTDFGNSQLRKEWFFVEPDSNRKLFTDYFLEFPETVAVGRSLYESRPLPNSSNKAAAEFWLLNEPFNFDWVVPQAYELQSTMLRLPMIPRLKFPCKFEFTLPWSETGFLEVSLKMDGAVQPFGKVFGLWSLAFLRQQLERRFPQAKGKLFIWNDGKRSYETPMKEEKEFCVSSVIRKDLTYYIELK